MSNIRILVVCLVVMSLVTGFLAGFVFGNKGAASTTPITQFASSAPVAAAAISVPDGLRPFLAGWNCPCGTCTDTLLQCPCSMAGGATEARKFIVDLYNDNVSLEEIREKAVRRYGQSITGGTL